HCMLAIAEERSRPRARRADYIVYVAAHEFLLRREIVLEQAPINRCWRVLIEAVIVHIPNHPNDFMPGVGGADLHQFPNSSCLRAPVLPSEIFRDNDDWTFLKLFLPGHVSPHDQWDAHGGKETW